MIYRLAHPVVAKAGTLAAIYVPDEQIGFLREIIGREPLEQALAALGIMLECGQAFICMEAEDFFGLCAALGAAVPQGLDEAMWDRIGLSLLAQLNAEEKPAHVN